MREIAPGLIHWTAPHPGWDPEGEPGSPANWPEQVGCTLYGNVFIDPLVPEALLPALLIGETSLFLSKTFLFFSVSSLLLALLFMLIALQQQCLHKLPQRFAVLRHMGKL